MSLQERLAELPQQWRSGVPLALLEACFDPADAPESSPLPQTSLRRVRLRCQPARASALGVGAFKIESPAEFFIRLGWTPIPYFDTMEYMRPPGQSSAPEILVPIPDDEPLLDLAYERATAGGRWEGTAWHWPAKFEPPQVSRVWEAGGTVLWDGRDEHGNPTGGVAEQGPGWRDKSSLASFTIGYRGIWQVDIAWKPGPFLTEEIAGEPSFSREVWFPRSWTTR